MPVIFESVRPQYQNEVAYPSKEDPKKPITLQYLTFDNIHGQNFNVKLRQVLGLRDFNIFVKHSPSDYGFGKDKKESVKYFEHVIKQLNLKLLEKALTKQED